MILNDKTKKVLIIAALLTAVAIILFAITVFAGREDLVTGSFIRAP